MDADYFDEWFAGIGRSAAEQRLFSDALGVPPEVGPSNLLPLDGLEQIASRLELSAGGLLVDLACGRGGPGMWLARTLEARLIGVDFSAEAVSQAMARRQLFGLEPSASFAVGSFADTGLPRGCADAVACIDAFQFAGDPTAAAREIRRVMRTGARVVLTTWEAVERGDPALPDRVRGLDVAAALQAAGFASIERVEQPHWLQVERGLWEQLALIDPAGDPALESARDEAIATLPIHDRRARIMVTATA